MRAHAGTLCPDDAHQLLDELLHPATPVPEHKHPLNDFLAALAGAPPSDACGDGLSLATALFNRVCREAPQAAPFTDHTYLALVECCYRARRPNLALSFLARFLKTGLNSDGLVANALMAMSSSSPSSPTLRVWSPIAAFSAATASVHEATLSPEDAHKLFDELLREAAPVPELSLNGLLAAFARAPASDACRDGPALAISLFNRVS
jgi:hypothetical protein